MKQKRLESPVVPGKLLTHSHTHWGLVTCKRAKGWCNCSRKRLILVSVQWWKPLEVLNTGLLPQGSGMSEHPGSANSQSSLESIYTDHDIIFQREILIPCCLLAKIKWKTYLVCWPRRQQLRRTEWDSLCRSQGHKQVSCAPLPLKVFQVVSRGKN